MLDFNAGVVLEGTPLAEVGKALLDKVVAVADGRPSPRSMVTSSSSSPERKSVNRRRSVKTIGTVCLKVVDVIGKICEYICAALAMIITLLVFIQVILRALNMPLFGIEELLTFPTIWIYFLGGACASFTDSHIECGLVGAVAKNPKAIAGAKSVANICATGLSIYVLKWASEYTQYSLKVSKISAVLKIPMPIGECVILAGLALMALFTLTRTIQNLVALKDVFKKEGGAA